MTSSAVSFRLEKTEMRMRLLDAAGLTEDSLCLAVTANGALSAFAGEFELMPTFVTFAVGTEHTLDDVHFVANLLYGVLV